MKQIKRGQRITVIYEGREFEVIVIDPNGLGDGQPSLGFGFGMAEQHIGLPQPTISQWFEGDSNSDQNILKLPSGNVFRVIQIFGFDNNLYQVIEISDWVAIVGDVLKRPGKIRTNTKERLIDFLTWFATKGLYADAYVVLKDSYTIRDSRAISNWMLARLSGKVKRNKYTDFLKERGCQSQDYAFWTNYIYEGLFDKTAQEMKQLWSVVEGDKNIARNYISEEDGLKAVAHCENLVVELYIDNLKEAHDDAINNAKRKFSSVLRRIK